MKRAICLLCLFVFSLNFCCAQIDPEETREHVILKWSPLSMFDIDNTVQIGIEIPFKNDRFTIQQEAGYGNSNFNVWYAQEEHRPDESTVKSRTQFRYYFYEKTRFRSYVAGEYMYKRVVTREMQGVGRECSLTGGCSYFQNTNVKQGRFVGAFHVKAGWQFYYSNRTTFDLFAGIGLRRANIKMLTPNVENVRIDNDWYFWRNNSIGRQQVVPSLSLGFHLGIALGKFNKTNR